MHLLGTASPSTAPAASDSSLIPLLLMMVLLMLLLLFLQRHLQLVIQSRDGSSSPCVTYSGSGCGAVGAYDTLGVVPLFRGFTHIIAQPFA